MKMNCRICKKEILERHVITTRKGTMMYCTHCKIFMFKPIENDNPIGMIARNKLDNPLEGEPCFGCDYHYIEGLLGRCNPNKDDCVIEEMMKKDGSS